MRLSERDRQLQEKISHRVAMLAFVRGDPPTPQGVDNNGTASFVQFPKGKFIITSPFNMGFQPTR